MNAQPMRGIYMSIIIRNLTLQSMAFGSWDSHVAAAVVEHYDTMLCVHSLSAHTDMIVMVGNEALYDSTIFATEISIYNALHTPILIASSRIPFPP